MGKRHDNIPLQPLRISTGWNIQWNTFYEIDPEEGLEYYFAGSSLLTLKNDHLNIYIDVAWRPESDLNGEYQVSIINFTENFNPKTSEYKVVPDWGTPHLEFSTSSRRELVEKLEKLFVELPIYRDPRILQRRGVVSEPSESLRLELLEYGLTQEIVSKVLDQGNSKIQTILLDHEHITREILLIFSKNGYNQKVKNKANQKLTSRQFR